MNHKEFRPGNLVNVSGKPETITGILQFGMYFHLMYYPFNLSQIEPIPLTEEWLVKFGFEIKRKQYSLNVGNELIRYAIKEHFAIWSTADSSEMKMKKQGFGWVINECYSRNEFIYKYVHQLQNLYFALTGNELTIVKRC